MKLMKRLFAIVLILTMTFGLVIEAGAADSPVQPVGPANPGYDPATKTDTNTQDHQKTDSTVTSTIGDTGATVTGVENNGDGDYCLLIIARNENNEQVAIDTVAANALNSKKGQKVARLTVRSNKITLKANALKGSKVKKLKITSKKVTFEKGAFTGTKVTNPEIALKQIKKASDVTFKKGCFSGLKNATIVVSTSMSTSEFNKLKKNLEKAGFTGKLVKRNGA